jgi:hypothetical protein
MKVIKVENLKTKQEYYASVDDSELRLDPWGIFSESLQTLTPDHKMSNVRVSVLKINVTPEAAAAEVIIQRRLNPNSIKPDLKPTHALKEVTHSNVADDIDNTENSKIAEDASLNTIPNKDLLKNKKGNNV